MNFTEKPLNLVFEDKETAKSFAKEVSRKCRLTSVGSAKVRKALPEFKHHLQRGFSVFLTPFSFADTVEIMTLAKASKGYKRKWGEVAA